MLAASPVEHSEEWAIHDYEGFGNKSLCEYEGIDSVVNLANFMARYGELGGAILSEYSVEDAEILMEEHYHGAYNSEVDFAEAIFDDCDGNRYTGQFDLLFRLRCVCA